MKIKRYNVIVLLYNCETWSPMLKNEPKLKVGPLVPKTDENLKGGESFTTR